MGKRKIIKIDEDKCNGCGKCLPNCPEGAIQVIGGKARLVSDLFCDGLGACLGHCPQGAIIVEEREAAAYDEKEVMENIVKHGPDVIQAHLKHLHDHGEHNYLRQAMDFLRAKGIEVPQVQSGSVSSACGCPGAKVVDFRNEAAKECKQQSARQESQLRQWPIQLALVPAHAPYLKNADLIIAADCVAFAYADFQQELLKGRTLLVACPKLDNIEQHKNKINQIVLENDLKAIVYARMEVPCCAGLIDVIKQALVDVGKTHIPFREVVISIKGLRL